MENFLPFLISYCFLGARLPSPPGRCSFIVKWQLGIVSYNVTTISNCKRNIMHNSFYTASGSASFEDRKFPSLTNYVAPVRSESHFANHEKSKQSPSTFSICRQKSSYYLNNVNIFMKASHPRQLKLAVLSLAIDWIGSHSRKLKRLICLLALTQFWCGKLSRLVKITTPQITILCLFAQFCHCHSWQKRKNHWGNMGKEIGFEMDLSRNY